MNTMKILIIYFKIFYMVKVMVNERRIQMSRHGTNIRKRADGRWEGRYKVLLSDQSYKYRSVYGKTCREVKEKLESVRTITSECMDVLEKETKETAEEIYEKNSKKSEDIFAAIALKWLEWIKETRKYSTYIKYRGIYERHIKNTVGDTSVYNISSSFVNEKVFHDSDEAGYSQNLRHSILAVMNQILKYAAENDGYPEIQLANKLSYNKSKRIEIINHTEQASLIRYLYQEIDVSKAGILLCIFTGLRLGEICSLKWEDIDFEQMLIHVCRTVQRIAIDEDRNRTTLMITEPKSAFSVREIPISVGIVQILNKIKHDEEYVIGGKKPVDPRTYQNRFKRYLKAAAVKEYNFHALRHTFATNCIDYDMDVKSLSEILGHANIQITLNKYVHPTMDTKRRQLAALDSVYGQFCGD